MREMLSSRNAYFGALVPRTSERSVWLHAPGLPAVVDELEDIHRLRRRRLHRWWCACHAHCFREVLNFGEVAQVLRRSTGVRCAVAKCLCDVSEMGTQRGTTAEREDRCCSGNRHNGGQSPMPIRRFDVAAVGAGIEQEQSAFE